VGRELATQAGRRAPRLGLVAQRAGAEWMRAPSCQNTRLAPRRKRDSCRPVATLRAGPPLARQAAAQSRSSRVDLKLLVT
jgi:hypothetical protein